MALGAEAFCMGGTKRSCDDRSSCSKKVCLGSRSSIRPSSESSSEDGNSDDEQLCYMADQVRAKRRASSRMSFSMSSELSRAVAQYSDEEDAELDRTSIGCSSQNIDCRLVGSSGDASDQQEKRAWSDSDKLTRSRCFEYLVGAIDEAWARYCDVTTVAEDKVYGYGTPGSIATDDEDYLGNSTDFTDYESDFVQASSKAARCVKAKPISAIGGANGDVKPTLASTSSAGLLALKDRLIKAKYYLQDLVDSEDMSDVCAFWKRWDMIKYTIIELVEDDDDDDVVEATIEELEDGRCYVK